MKLPDVITFETIPELALEWHQKGRGAVLATVVQTWGSAPRRIGAQLVVSGDGSMQGSVSGGCVEGAVVLEARPPSSPSGSKGIYGGDSMENKVEPTPPSMRPQLSHGGVRPNRFEALAVWKSMDWNWIQDQTAYISWSCF